MNIYSNSRGLFKRLHSFFSYKARMLQYKNKVKKAINYLDCAPLTNSQVSEVKEYYKSLGFKNINTDWHRYFTHVSGKFYKEYMPEDLFFNVVEPNLNMNKMLPALTDKNLLEKIFNNVKQPKTIIKNINGFFYDSKTNEIIQFDEVLKICNEFSKLIIKPSMDSFGGNNIIVFKLKDNKTDYNELSVGNLIKLYKKDFIIQEFLEQHEQMSLLNQSSVNTIRSTTLLINGEVEILRDIVRIGGKDSTVDNTSKGGIWCVIKPDGILREKGYFDPGEFVLETDSKVKLEGFEIPNYQKIKKVIKHLHKQIPYFKIVSWDIAIDREGNAVLIEYNVEGQGMDGQYAYGPLFREFTDEILNSCSVNKFSNYIY